MGAQELGRSRLGRGRRVASSLVVLGTVGLAIWSAGSVAHACDPVTGVGCDMNTPPAAPANPTPAPSARSNPTPAAPPQPQGQPFIPPDQQQVPGAPVEPTPPSSSGAEVPPAANPAPTPAVEQAPASSSDDSGGGGVPWKLGLLVPAVVLAGVGVGTLARKRRTPEDAIAEYQRTCAHLCWAKATEAQAEADVAAAQAQLKEIDAAWKRARDYLFNQLRDDYVNARRNRAYGSAALSILGGPLTWGGGASHLWHWGYRHTIYNVDRCAWNEEVNEALESGQAEIDRMRNEAAAQWTAKLKDAHRIQDETFNARHEADSRLSYLRGYHPDVTFPECACP